MGEQMNRRTCLLDQPDPSGGYAEISEYADGRRPYTLNGDFHRADGRQAWHPNTASTAPRGRGAMIAAEFVDPITGEPDAALASRVAQAAQSEN